MQNFLLVKCLQPPSHLDEAVPDLLFTKKDAGSLILHHFVVEVAPVSELHHYAQTTGVFVKERLLVRNNVGVLNRGQDSHLIKRIEALFYRQLADLDLSHSKSAFCGGLNLPA